MKTLACLFGLVFFAVSQSNGALKEIKINPVTDSLQVSKPVNFSDKYFNKLNSKTTGLEDKLANQTDRYISKLDKQEEKLKRKLSAFDSTAAATLFSVDPSAQYNLLEQKLKSVTSKSSILNSGDYLANTDSLQNALSFFIKNPKLLNSAKEIPRLQQSLDQLKVLQGKMQIADQLKQIIEQRKEQIKTYLSKFTNLPNGITKAYQDYSKQLVYYKQQVQEYKDMLNDPDKMTRKAIALANKIPAFSDFMKKNSMLAGLFNLGGDYEPNKPGQGLPTRDAVMASFASQSGLTPQKLTGVVQKGVETASSQVDAMQDMLMGLIPKGSGSTLEDPNFKPSAQKTKSFLKRLELGVNIQTARSTNFFPATTDLGLSLGYKINDNNVVGIGMSYKIGWGSGFNHIQVTSEGIGLRSFVDIKVKKNIFVSGGFEYNYQKPFNSYSQIKILNDWQRSGLLGIGKIISLKSQTVKKTKIQLLWDFLSYEQIPQTQPFIFRIGYTF